MRGAQDPVVEVEHFRMDFGAKTVIRDLGFEVARGETFGFLGSNGSGKTTTIRALLGITEPTAGRLWIDGRPFRPQASGRLGYLPEERGLYRKEAVLDTMVYFGRLKGMAPAAARSWSLDYLERVGIPELAKTRLDKLSGGQQQKVQLGVTVMNSPELLILDEPTKGFDPVNRRLLMDIVEEQRRGGATIVMVTHQMDEVERLCDRILLLKDGTARAYGTVAEVQEAFGGTTLRFRHSGTLPPLESIPGLEEVRLVADRDGEAEAAPPPGRDPAALLAALVGAGVQVSSFVPLRRSLDSIFVEIYGERAGEGE